MLSVLILIVCSSFNNALPTGAPSTTCSTMTPNHGTNSAQTLSSSPYSIEVNLMQNGEATVTVINNTAETKTFQGILLEARTTSNGSAVGSWVLPGENFQRLNCSSGSYNAITHTNSNNKPLPMSFTWISPSVSTTTNYTFYATIAETYNVFYVMIPSSPITIESSVQEHTSTESLTTTSTTSTELLTTASNTNATTLSTASTSSTTPTTTMSTDSTTPTTTMSTNSTTSIPTSTTTAATNETTMSTGTTTSTTMSNGTTTSTTTMSTGTTTSTTTMSTGTTTSTTTMSTTSAAVYHSYIANNIILALLCLFLVALM